MTLADIEMTQGCCGEHYQWAEVQCPTGWLRIKRDQDGCLRVTQFGNDKQLTIAERQATVEEIEALL
jgi:hypothetical protein